MTTTTTMNSVDIKGMPKTFETVKELFRLSSEVEPSLANSNRRIAGEDVVMDRELSDFYRSEAKALREILAEISYQISEGNYRLYGTAVHCCGGSKFAILSTEERRALCYKEIKGIPESEFGKGAWYADEIAAYLRPLVEERAKQAD